jgi:hypothetical protein
MKQVGVLFALSMASVIAGCSYHLDVRRGAPHPNVVFDSRLAPSQLVIGPGVEDTFIVPNTGAIYQVNVFEWRDTIQAGYDDAFPPGGTGSTLEITRAELSFIPEAVDASGVTRAARAQIRFQARVTDASGVTQQFADTVTAREALTDISGTIPTANAAVAVEAMYESIAAHFFSTDSMPTSGGEVQ